jgi:hypothetical protein
VFCKPFSFSPTFLSFVGALVLSLGIRLSDILSFFMTRT